MSNMEEIVSEIVNAYNSGYKQGTADAAAYIYGCGVESPITNADRIRSMSDEKLAKYCAWLEDPQACYIWEDYDNQDCISQWIDWLKEEAE